MIQSGALGWLDILDSRKLAVKWRWRKPTSTLYSVAALPFPKMLFQNFYERKRDATIIDVAQVVVVVSAYIKSNELNFASPLLYIDDCSLWWWKQPPYWLDITILAFARLFLLTKLSNNSEIMDRLVSHYSIWHNNSMADLRVYFFFKSSKIIPHETWKIAAQKNIKTPIVNDTNF